MDQQGTIPEIRKGDSREIRPFVEYEKAAGHGSPGGEQDWVHQSGNGGVQNAADAGEFCSTLV